MDDCCNAAPRFPGSPEPRTFAREPAIETLLEIEGAACGACVARVEGALRGVPGVAEAHFSLPARRAWVTHAKGVNLVALQAAVSRAGYRARPPGTEEDRRRAGRLSLLRAGVAGLAMMQVMMFAFPVYVADEGTLTWDAERLFALASLALTLPVLLFSAAPIWTGAFRGLRAGRLGMDVPVALGLIAAFAASLPATFFGGPVYYEAITMFVFFLSAGRHVEARALAATVDAGEALAQMLPRRVVRLVASGREEVDALLLAPGDRVWIAAGEAAPADCVVVAGRTEFDEALLTGESAPAAKAPGDALLAGSVNLSAPVEARVERAGDEHTLAFVRRLVERAGAEKPQWAQLADRIAAHFVLAVLVLAAGAALYWLQVDPQRALPVVIAVLVVSCPCALSLAAPVALAAGANALAKAGVLVTRGAAMEALAKVDRIVFDKTGTLTTGRLHLANVNVLGGWTRERCLAVAASLEQAMPHPVAHGLVAAAPGVLPFAGLLTPVPGCGVEAVIDGRRHRVGSAVFCAELAGSPLPVPADGAPMAALACEGAWLAAFRFDDTLRPEARGVVRRLRDLGCEVSILSGDRAAVVDRVSRSTRISDVAALASPEAKVAWVRHRQALGETVAMVGDGVNDAAALAGADVAIALGQGTAAARSQADLVVLHPSLEAIPQAVATARKVRRVVAQNLAWAAAYNALTLPLALTGVLTPWMASVGMSLSSLLVVGNSLRILRRPQPLRSVGPD